MLKMVGRMVIRFAIQRLMMMIILAAVMGGGLICSMNGSRIPGLPSITAVGSLFDWSSEPKAESQVELKTGPQDDIQTDIEDPNAWPEELPAPTQTGSEVTVNTGFEVLTVSEVETSTCTVHLSGPPRKPEIYMGKVVRVSDGDTLVIDSIRPRPDGFIGEVRVRLWGIDAPERSQAGGDESLNALLGMTPRGSTIHVNKVGEDMYDRWLAVVAATADGTAVNTRLVAEGQAYFLSSFEARGNTCLATAQAEAVAAKLGVWANSNAEFPWDYRYRTK